MGIHRPPETRKTVRDPHGRRELLRGSMGGQDKQVHRLQTLEEDQERTQQEREMDRRQGRRGMEGIMSVSLWAYDPVRCEGHQCCGDCDYCPLKNK